MSSSKIRDQQQRGQEAEDTSSFAFGPSPQQQAPSLAPTGYLPVKNPSQTKSQSSSSSKTRVSDSGPSLRPANLTHTLNVAGPTPFSQASGPAGSSRKKGPGAILAGPQRAPQVGPRREPRADDERQAPATRSHTPPALVAAVPSNLAPPPPSPHPQHIVRQARRTTASGPDVDEMEAESPDVVSSRLSPSPEKALNVPVPRGAIGHSSASSSRRPSGGDDHLQPAQGRASSSRGADKPSKPASQHPGSRRIAEPSAPGQVAVSWRTLRRPVSRAC